jgi:predicted DNA-binding transcriptional regulator AlpA
MAGADLQTVLKELRELRRAVEQAPKRLLNVEEAAHYCGLSPKTIRNGLGPKAVKPFPVKAVKLAGRVLFRREDLDKHIDSLADQALAEMRGQP